MSKEKSDGSHADYYKLPDGATQLQDLISYRNQNAQIGEIFRACYRYGLCGHSDEIRDIKKIIFYAQAELERLEKLSLHESVKNGWIEWNGGECPVEEGIRVFLKLRDGKVRDTFSVCSWSWDHNGQHEDIIGYRIVQSTKP